MRISDWSSDVCSSDLEDGLNMSYKRITVSTAGIAKMIRRLGDDGARFNLALSLHAANDRKRHEIMPIGEQNSLEALRDALKYYFSTTKNPVTYERSEEQTSKIKSQMRITYTVYYL